MNYKEITLSRTTIPTYNDGCFKLFEIKQKNTTYPEEYIKEVTSKPIWFKELSLINFAIHAVSLVIILFTFAILIDQPRKWIWKLLLNQIPSIQSIKKI